VTISNPGSTRAHHIQIITGVTYGPSGMTSGYLAMQGNFKTNLITGGRLYASNDPTSFRYPGVNIQQGAYDRSNDTWYNASLHTATPGFMSTENKLDFRSFNFENWNKKYEYTKTQSTITFTSPTTLIPTTSTYSTLERKEVSPSPNNNKNNK